MFARQGYADTVVDDIAGQAGIGKGTLYLYFRSKEEIFTAALVEDARRLDDVTRQRMEEVQSWQDKVRAYIRVRLEYLDTHEDFMRIYLSEFRSMMVRGMRVQPELYQVLRNAEGQLAQLFAAAIARHEVRPIDPERAAMTVIELTRGLMERRLLGFSRDTSVPDEEFALDLLSRAFKA